MVLSPDKKMTRLSISRGEELRELVSTGGNLYRYYTVSVTLMSMRSERILRQSGIIPGGIAKLSQNISFCSPNQAAQFVTGRSTNAWTAWKNKSTMDEVIRKGEK